MSHVSVLTLGLSNRHACKLEILCRYLVCRGSPSCRQNSIPAPTGPLMLEASLQFNAGVGLLLSPSVICTRARDTVRAAIALRSEINF